VTHYAHRKHDPKTGRFAKIKPEPHTPPCAPQADPSDAEARAERRLRAAEAEAEAWELLTEREKRQVERRERHEENAALLRAECEREHREATRPDWVQDPRRLGEPGGDGDGGLGAF